MLSLIARIVNYLFDCYDGILGRVAMAIEFDEKQNHQRNVETRVEPNVVMGDEHGGVSNTRREEDDGDVFVSYKTDADKKICKEVVLALDAANLKVSIDTSVLHAGDKWEPSLERMIRNASCVVVIWTEHSVKSKYVIAEAALARVFGTLLPCRDQSVESEACPYYDTHTVNIDLSSGNDGLIKLVEHARMIVQANKKPHLRFQRKKVETVTAYRVGGLLLVLVAVSVGLIWWSTEQNRRFSQPIRDISVNLSFSIRASDVAEVCPTWKPDRKQNWQAKMERANFGISPKLPVGKVEDGICVCHDDEKGFAVDILSNSDLFPKTESGGTDEEHGVRRALCPPLVALAFAKPGLKSKTLKRFLTSLDRDVPADRDSIPPGVRTVYKHHENFPRDGKFGFPGNSDFLLHYDNPKGNSDATPTLLSQTFLTSGFQREEGGAQMGWIEDLCGSQLILCLTRDDPNAAPIEKQAFSGLRNKMQIRRLELTIGGHRIELKDGKRHISENGNLLYEFTLPTSRSELFSPEEKYLTYSDMRPTKEE